MSRAWDRTPKPKTATLRPFGGEVLPLELDDSVFFLNHYELPFSVSGEFISYTPATGRYVLPVLSPEGLVRGLVLRKPWPGAPRKAIEPYFELPKADTYMSRYEPVQSFYRADSNVLVAVEDQLSAIKLATYGYSA